MRGASDYLQHVTLPVINIKECIAAHKKQNHSFPVTPHKNICAGGEEGKIKYFLKIPKAYSYDNFTRTQ